MTKLEQIPFDDAKAEAFAGRFAGLLSDGAAALMTSLGHRAGLFDRLSMHPGETADRLAELGGYNARYVREWLAVMVTAGIVEYDPEGATYRLPPEHAVVLTRAASPNNMAVTSQFLGVAAGVEDEMLDRFRSGKGLHYGHFARFHEVMAEDSYQGVVLNLIDAILPVVPGLAERLDRGIAVADVGCGGGWALLKLAETFPNSHFIGFDLCADAFAAAEAEARAAKLDNLRYEALDLSRADSLGRFGLVLAFDAVHDQKDPMGLLRTVKASLTEDGVFLMQDIGGSRDLEKNIGNPFAPLLYTISAMHCTPISIGQGGPGLGAMWGVETAQEYLAEAGFAGIEMHRLPHDPLNAYFVARAGEGRP